MNLELKVLSHDENASFRHPEFGLNRCPDSKEEWEKVVWHGESIKPTYQALVDLEYPLEYRKSKALEQLRRPFVYNGVPLGTLRADMSFYDTMQRASERDSLDFPTFILGVDGSMLSIVDSSDMTAFHNAVVAEANKRAKDAAP